MKKKAYEGTLKQLALKVEPLGKERRNGEVKPTIGRPRVKGGGNCTQAARGRTYDEEVADFWFRVRRGSENECWPWTAGKHERKEGKNYGIVWINGRRLNAARVAYELYYDQPPGKMFVCHSCDNPPCCNPAHLFLGTPKDNNNDCRKKGRAYIEMGSARYNAKLTEEQVKRIKREAPQRKYGWGRQLAKEFGVAPTAINNIVSGLRWKQVLI